MQIIEILLLIAIASTAIVQSESDPGGVESDVDFTCGVRILVEDGTQLNGTLYRPSGSGGQQLSIIVTITPYISDRNHPDTPSRLVLPVVSESRV